MLPKTWTPVTIPEQKSLEWKIVTKDVPAHYDARFFDGKAGDYVKRDEPKVIRFWQATDPAVAPLDAEQIIRDEVAARRLEPLHGAGCPGGMVRVRGRMKDWEIVDILQDTSCRVGPDGSWNPSKLCYIYDLRNFARNYEFLRDEKRVGKNPAPSDQVDWVGTSAARIARITTRALRAREYGVSGFAAQLHGKPLLEKDLDYCMDRYEYPNVKGAYPVIMVNWFDARSICEGDGKRLCSEDEWTFGCEGEEASPYPTGDIKDPTACNFDRVRKANLDEATVMQFDTPAARKMIAALFGAVPSGAMERCTSSFGVHDLTGNVDEWTHWSAPGRPRDMSANAGKGLLSTMKGGFWGPVRNRCQPSTSSHGPDFLFYQQGFRCCSNAGHGQ